MDITIVCQKTHEIFLKIIKNIANVFVFNIFYKIKKKCLGVEIDGNVESNICL